MAFFATEISDTESDSLEIPDSLDLDGFPNNNLN